MTSFPAKGLNDIRNEQLAIKKEFVYTKLTDITNARLW